MSHVYQSYLLFLIPLFPLLGFFINGSLALQKARGRGFVGTGLVSFVACLMPILSFGVSLYSFWVLKNLPSETGHAYLQTGSVVDWMVLQNIKISLGFYFDHLSSLMILIITGVGSLIHIYSTGYMHDDSGYAKYMSYLNLFLFFMLTLVLADSLPLLFVGWEGVGLCSYLLIGFWFSDLEKAKAGRKAFVVNRIGDLAFLMGMFMIVAHFSSLTPAGESLPFLNFEYILNNKHLLTPVVACIALCLFIGATGKSAQIPLYVWLPDAMAGPTPVSALIHAATMVTAGIYLIARLGAIFVMAPQILNIIAICGGMTALFAALIAITQYDIKKVLAYSTVSQLGYMFLALGTGAFSAAIFHVMTHAFFKACLFLGSGSVIHALHHEQDIRKMGGLFKKMPITGLTFLISTLAIAGFPGLSGFFSKDEILYLTYTHGSFVLWGMAVLTAGLTAFYMMRLFVCTFLGKTRYDHPEKIHESSFVMTLPLVVLAVLASVSGYLGLPHMWGHSWIGEWLHFLGDVSKHHHDAVWTEGTLMMISSSWGLFMMTLAFLVYRFFPKITGVFKSKGSVLYQLMVQKFKVDEVYSTLILKPVQGLASLLKVLDVKIIDGLLVDGVAHSVSFMGKTFASLHTGLIRHYLAFLIAGVVLIVWFLTF